MLDDAVRRLFTHEARVRALLVLEQREASINELADELEIRPGERSSDWRKLKARHLAAAELAYVPPGRPLEQVWVVDELGRWPVTVWPGPVRQQLEQLGTAAVGRPLHVAYSRRDANGAPREARIAMLGSSPALSKTA